MTEKLYYTDAYLKEFDAEVISSTKTAGGYETVLNRTAFFPEEGGQFADTGYIGDVRVTGAVERDGVIYHLTDIPVAVGGVHCTLDFDERFEKMQSHTAEHIMCGIIHEIFGYDNVGFHLGNDLVTFDVNGELTADEIGEVEGRANEVVFANLPVRAYFPGAEELASLEYRSKTDIRGSIRIVDILGIDRCACCAPHVNYTGEIGLVKVVDFMRHRGGMRITVQVGRRALRDYRRRYEITRAIGAMTSTPSTEVTGAVESLVAERDRLAYELKTARLRLVGELARAMESTDGNRIEILEGFDIGEMREFANSAASKVGGILVLLSPDDGGYKYLIASRAVNLREYIKAANSLLSGRGGGAPEMVSGRFNSSVEAIREYFK